VLAGVQAQAEYEGQDGVPGGTSPSIGRPEAHCGNGKLHSDTRFDYISSSPQTMLKTTTVEVLLTKN